MRSAHDRAVLCAHNGAEMPYFVDDICIHGRTLVWGV
jgi:hypothetical protein